MTIDDDIAMIAEQERRLQFEHFDFEMAWQLGSKMRELALSRGLVLSLDVTLLGSQVFFSALPGSKPDFEHWIRRKRNLVLRYLRSSYGLGLELKKLETSLEERWALSSSDYAAHGGCFPIVVKGIGCIGAATVSGLPQREDHNLVVEGLAHVAGVADLPQLS